MTSLQRQSSIRTSRSARRRRCATTQRVSGAQVYLTLHAWSTQVGFPEVRKVADAVVESLHLAPITLPTNRLISIMHRQTRTFRDADGLTSHAVIEFVANTEKPLA